MPPKSNNNYSQNLEQIKAVKKELKELYALESSINELQFKRLEKLEKQATKLGNVLKSQRAFTKEMKTAVSDFEDMDDLLVSFGNELKKNTKFVEKQRDVFDNIKVTTGSIASELAAGGTANEKTRNQVIAMTNSYKAMHVSIADTNKEYALGKITNAERVEQIKQQSEAFQSVAAKIDMSNVSSQELTEQLKNMTNEGHSFAEAMKKSEMATEQLDNIFESFEGIPALGQVNTLLKTNIKDTVAFKAAVFALGAALGAAAMNYFGAPMKAALQAEKEIHQAQIDGIAERAKMDSDAKFISNDSVIKGQKNYTKIQEEADNNRMETAHNVAQAMNEAAFAGQRAANAFSASMKSGAAQFQRAAKTALFGKSIGSIGYGAAQMQLAGIGADKIASAMEAAGAATGKMPTAKAAADMAVMAERTGQSVDDIAGINEAFQRMDGMSAEVAMNMQEGMRNMADQAGIGLGNLMKEVAEASKEALGYQIKSGPALAKAVAYTQSMGLNFGDVAKAGKNMVMNYKDSIKAEMQLSSMLGEQVDLAEVRAKFAAGDQAGALESLKAQGLDPADMDMFQQQALQDALGGMDLNSLSKVANNTGKDGGNLAAADAKSGNQQFLTKTQQAEASLSATEAKISADQAVIDAKLSGDIADKFINSEGHKKYLEDQVKQAKLSSQLTEEMDKLWKGSKEYNDQLANTMKLNFVDGVKEKLLEGAGALAGGLLTTGLSKIPFGKMFGKKPKGGPDASAAPSASEGPGASPITSVAAAGVDTLVPGAGPFVEAAASNADAADKVITKVDTIKSKFKSFASTAKSILKEAGGIFKTFIKVIQDVGNQLITSVTDMLSKVLTSVQTLGGQLADTIGSVVGKIVDNVGAVLTKAVDIVTQIGNKLATGVMKIFNTVVDGLTKASSSLPTLLGNLGKAVGAFFSGMSAGLTTFAMAMAAPTPFFGLPVGLIVVGMAMGLAKALSIAAPGIEALTPLLIGLADVVGGTFVKAMQAAGPIITAIFDGIAKVIKTIGDAISGVILSITDSISRLSGLDASQMGAVALGITAMAGAVAIFGGASAVGGFMSAVGKFFDGDPVVKFQRFQALDAAQLNAVADAIKYLGTGIASFVIAPTVAESVAALGKGFEEFADYLNDGEIDTINSFSSALGGLNIQLMQTAAISGLMGTAAAAFTNLAGALGSLASVNVKAINDLPWLRLIAFAGAGGRITLAQSANNSFNIAQDSAKNIEKLAADSKANVQISKNLQALLGVLAESKDAAFSLNIDGRAVTDMIKRREDNRKAGADNP